MSRKALARAVQHRADIAMLTDGPDDEIGYLVDGGFLPPEVQGRHCTECGEHIEAVLPRLPSQPGLVIAEWRHLDGYVHCVMSWENARPVGMGPCTATPCWREGCLSNAEHEALMRDATD